MGETLTSSSEVSPALAEAQARLLALRTAHQARLEETPEKKDNGRAHPDNNDRPAWRLSRPVFEKHAPTGEKTAVPVGVLARAGVAAGTAGPSPLPAPSSLVLQRHYQQAAPPVAVPETGPMSDFPPYDAEPPATAVGGGATTANSVLALDSATIPLFPGLACAMLDQQRVPDGRLWLLLRWLDEKGQGWLDTAVARRHVTAANSPFRVCGLRQWRHLLVKGEGMFWRQVDGRLWLRSAAKVAVALGIVPLSGQAIALPVKALLGGIGDVKAHFYASFHGGRKDSPISRAALNEVTGVAPRSQLRYEKRAGIVARSQIAVGDRVTAVGQEQQAWRHGRALFTLTDFQGQHGKPGRSYLAWRLPNRYDAHYRCYSRQRTRRLNRAIDLVNLRAQGNDGTRPQRLYFAGGAAAAQAYNRRGGAADECYWPGRQEGLWYVFGGHEH